MALWELYRLINCSSSFHLTGFIVAARKQCPGAGEMRITLTTPGWKGQMKSPRSGLKRRAERFDLEFAASKDPRLQSVFQRSLSVYEESEWERTENLETRCIRSLWHQTERELEADVEGLSTAPPTPRWIQIPGKKITSRHKDREEARDAPNASLQGPHGKE